MEREVVRIVTPGTVTDEALLEERRDTLLAAVLPSRGRFGLAWLDLSAGRFSVTELADRAALEAELERLRPAELLAPEGNAPPAVARGWRVRPPWQFDEMAAERALSEQFACHDLAGFGCEGLPLAIGAAGALLAYVQETQKSALPHLRSLNVEQYTDALVMDPATRRNLELDESLTGNDALTLAGVFDATSTAMCARQLRRWLHRPLRNQAQLRARYDGVDELIAAAQHVQLAVELRAIGDLERVLARVELTTIHSGNRQRTLREDLAVAWRRPRRRATIHNTNSLRS
jgi:DNA mismatch repair protein MutS